MVLTVCVGSAVMVAVVSVREQVPVDPALAAGAQASVAQLGRMPVVAQRLSRDDYHRDAFGPAWTDAVSVADGGNGCDTRNDILARDLTDTRVGAVASCPRAVLAGEFRSPYTGKFLVFARDRKAGAVQIDHIVPLALAWDMGAWSWSLSTRTDFANDPANLVAVDAASNQDKSDAEPARWMPPDKRFHCRYAIQFVTVATAYRLSVDAASRAVLAKVLSRCARRR
ncbi:HNH endonuclease family protein [Gordonia sp. CPCC 205515]|uniref:HNH endonuclease family protein n=1 Tax=Gordonia sp. CPCC 205515 TaxID=3140791 RepID=UPI003AF38A43